MYPNLCEAILEKLSEPIKMLVKEAKVAEKQAIRYAGEKSVAQELRLAILDKITPSVTELSRGLNVIKNQEPGDRHSGMISMNVLETFAGSIDDIMNSLTRIGANVEGEGLSSPVSEPREEVFREVFEQVSEIVYTDTNQSVTDLLCNIETAQRNIPNTIILEGLRQLSSLQKDLATTVTKVGENRNETSISALENIGQSINLLNNFVIDLTPSSMGSVLEECGVVLSILEDSVLATDLSSQPSDIKDEFSNLKDRVKEVRLNIIELSEQVDEPRQTSDDQMAVGDNVVVVLEETSVTVVPESLLEDTKSTLDQLQDSASVPSARMVLEPLLPHAVALYEISNDTLLRKQKDQLSEEDRQRLQNCVVPLELIEDRIIEALDFVMLTPGTPQRTELKNLLEHLQYNVAVMHQQVLDETHLAERRDSVPIIEEIKKSVIVLQNLPIMSEISGDEAVSPEIVKEIVECVSALEHNLATLYEVVMVEGMDQMPPNLLQ
ncbi:uncharacterized protein LOC115878951, partial [Sitophilus oryzae]|uniref:Uncharacterized protein LOC115878951 n=1 Tax=Sitophilus oryzae TaxID=7048 RepID=A0A6J2XIX3_SITOR